MDSKNTDILIIGSGISGSIAALTAAEENKQVMLITKCPELLSGNSPLAQGGIVYSNSHNSDQDQFKNDIIIAGDNHSDEVAIDQLIEWGGGLIESILLDKLSVPFEKNENNELIFTSEAAHSINRIIHCKDRTGFVIHNAIINEVKRNENITICENYTAIDLLTYSHHSKISIDIYKKPSCFGAIVLDNLNQDIITIYAHNTILATGGLGQVYLHTTNPTESKGDGIAMAWRAGARCINLQYIQFHPTTLFYESDYRFLISETLRGEGAKLYDINGNKFMKGVHPLHDLAPRDILARAICKQLLKTEHSCVYLDISHRESSWIKNRFPTIYKHCLDKGLDITVKPIPVVPAAHYSCGGVSVDLSGRSSIKHLYAIGEVSCTGIHGANRLASTSLLECIVWGYIAGKNSTNIDENYSPPKITEWEKEDKDIDPALIIQDWLTIKNTMWNYVGLMRTKERLKRAQYIFRNLQYDIERFYQKTKLTSDIIELRNGIQTAIGITNAAFEDKKSKGCHYIKSSS